MIQLMATDRTAALTEATPVNRAVWLTAKHGELKIGPAPSTRLRDDELGVRSRAIAVNPVNWMAVPLGDLLFHVSKLPDALTLQKNGVSAQKVAVAL